MKISRMSSTLGIVRSRSRSGHDFKLYPHLPQYKPQYQNSVNGYYTSHTVKMQDKIINDYNKTKMATLNIRRSI